MYIPYIGRVLYAGDSCIREGRVCVIVGCSLYREDMQAWMVQGVYVCREDTVGWVIVIGCKVDSSVYGLGAGLNQMCIYLIWRVCCGKHSGGCSGGKG